MDFRIGHGYDVHALADSLPLVLGGVEIAHTKGCVAHSDGDVAIHALCDALLGAAALGDIGLHFPDTSADFAGIDDDRVSVKATTTEHLGFEGREEGISVSAVALIYRPADRK